MRSLGNPSLIKRLEHLEQLLEVNEIRVYYASETIPGEPGAKIIRLRWLDVPEVALFECLRKDGEDTHALQI